MLLNPQFPHLWNIVFVSNLHFFLILNKKIKYALSKFSLFPYKGNYQPGSGSETSGNHSAFWETPWNSGIYKCKLGEVLLKVNIAYVHNIQPQPTCE